MRKILLLLTVLAAVAFGQTQDSSRRTNGANPYPQAFFGTTAPGSVTGNLPGDFYSDTTNHNLYQCNATSATAAPACTSVTSGGWTQINGGGGSGSCPGSGSTNAIQIYSDSTHCASSTATADTSGNIAATSIAIGSSPPSVTAGTAGGNAYKEGTAPSVCAAAGVQCLYADSTLHQLLLSVNGGSYFPLSATIAAGTSAMGTSAIGPASGGALTCATVVTVSATGVTTGDVISATPNADPTGITGYSGGLAIYAYPTANNVNFKVCNGTAGSLTPGALTLNFEVVRAL